MKSVIEVEMRRHLAENDAKILERDGAADDLDVLLVWTTNLVLED